MVEHMSAQTTQYQHQQSFNGVQTQRWHYRHRPNEFETPDLTNNGKSSGNHRFSLFKWFKSHDSASSANNTRRRIFRRSKRRPSTSSTSSSEDTYYSTATVRSFAFQSGIRRDVEHSSLPLKHSSRAVGPFAPGAVKLIEKQKHRDDKLQSISATDTCTLPSAFSQRKDIQTRYSLHPFNRSFISYDNIPIVDHKSRAFAEVRRNTGNDIPTATDSLTSNSSLSSTKKVHVKGKRRAPDPPDHPCILSVHDAEKNNSSRGASGGRRKRRPAPKPPGYIATLSSNQDTLSSETSIGMDSTLTTKDCQTISNDTLVLRKGVLLSKKDVHTLEKSESKTQKTPICDYDGYSVVDNQTTTSEKNGTKLGTIMPRPWYKRNVLNEPSSANSKEFSTNARKSGSDILRGLSSPLAADAKDENASLKSASSTLSSSIPFEGSFSKLGFFHRGDRHYHEDKKKEGKRKSGVSLLTNISELDKEAAAIVQEEQARNRASVVLQAAKLDEHFERQTGANDAIVRGIVNTSFDNSPRKTTRALISKLNAIGNITKVSVNSSFFAKSNNASPKAKTKRYSQECNNSRRDNNTDEKIERDLSRCFLPYQASSKRESASIFTESMEPNRPRATAADTRALTTLTTSPARTTTTTKTERHNNVKYVKSLAAELDDVATGIARLRRELDIRPKVIDNSGNDQENIPKQNRQSAMIDNKRNVIRDKELATFEKEFTKIFDEIDKQFKTRDSRITAVKPKASSTVGEPSISNQAAKVLDILVNAEKDVTAEKSVSPPMSDVKSIKPLEDFQKREMLRKGTTSNALRISSVDDKSTVQLKEMLKEMKHSLPKRPKPKESIESDKEAEKYNKSPDIINNKSSTNSSRTREETVALPKISSKVSSSAQTSGNVRKIVNKAAATTNLRSGESDVNHERSLKYGAAKNSYQLIKDNEFAKIEGRKSKAHQENTYANVIERYIYANAQIAPTSVNKVIEKKRRDSNSRVKIDSRKGDGKETALSVSPHVDKKQLLGIEKSDIINEEGEKLEEIKKQYMNTLAVNRLLRKLEASIALGHHQQAAGLAKELAQLKIHCSVVRQRSCKAKEKLNLNMYIEDKQTHQGPIPLQLPVNMTVAQLKAKIHIEFEIPANVQRWIIGKNLADNDESTLNELQAVEGSPVFLYLVAPPDLQDKELIKLDTLETNEDGKSEENQVDEELKEENNEQIDKMKAETKLDPETKADSEPDVKEKTGPQFREVQ